MDRLKRFGVMLVPLLCGTSAQAKDLTLGFSSNGLGYPFSAAIAKGFQEAAAKAHVKALVVDSRGDVQRQANEVDALIARKVDGMAFQPLDSTVAQGWVDRCAEARIPSVAVASQVGDPTRRDIKDVYDKLLALVTQDEIAAGQAAGELAARLLPRGREARIAIIEGAAGYAEVVQRTQGFLQGLKKAGARYQVVASQPGDWSPEKGEAACQNILAADPDVDFFFNQSDDMVVGCARAVRAAGSKAKLIGMGGSRLAIAAIRAGEIDGTVCYEPEQLGRLAFQSLHDALTGKRTLRAAFVSYGTPGVTRASVGQCAGRW